MIKCIVHIKLHIVSSNMQWYEHGKMLIRYVTHSSKSTKYESLRFIFEKWANQHHHHMPLISTKKDHFKKAFKNISNETFFIPSLTTLNWIENIDLSIIENQICPLPSRATHSADSFYRQLSSMRHTVEEDRHWSPKI